MQNEIVALTKHTLWTLHKNNVWEIIYLCHRNFLQHVMTQVTEILQHVMTHPGHGNPAALDNSFHRNSAPCDFPCRRIFAASESPRPQKFYSLVKVHAAEIL